MHRSAAGSVCAKAGQAADNDGNCPQPMTIALLLALVASLGLMAVIVKRLERA